MVLFLSIYFDRFSFESQDMQLFQAIRHVQVGTIARYSRYSIMHFHYRSTILTKLLSFVISSESDKSLSFQGF